jgi:hypothetical protein
VEEHVAKDQYIGVCCGDLPDRLKHVLHCRRGGDKDMMIGIELLLKSTRIILF